MARPTRTPSTASTINNSISVNPGDRRRQRGMATPFLLAWLAGRLAYDPLRIAGAQQGVLLFQEVSDFLEDLDRFHALFDRIGERRRIALRGSVGRLVKA